MLVRTLTMLEVMGRIRFPADESFRSARFFTADDRLGFSYNENRVKGGTRLNVWLKHHWEANYIISGRGTVTDLTREETWVLEEGMRYVVGPNDKHGLVLTEDESYMSIFCPPLRGDERFDADGSYEASGPIEKTDRRMFVKHVDELRRLGGEERFDNGNVSLVPMLTGEDKVGFCLSRTSISKGSEYRLNPSGKAGVCHVLSGHGVAVAGDGGEKHQLHNSVAISVDTGDDCRIVAESDLLILNVFS